MGIRYVRRDGMQVGILYATAQGIHVVTGKKLVELFERIGRINDLDLIIHPEDEDEGRFIEFSKPAASRTEVDGMLDKIMEDNDYDISPSRF